MKYPGAKCRLTLSTLTSNILLKSVVNIPKFSFKGRISQLTPFIKLAEFCSISPSTNDPIFFFSPLDSVKSKSGTKDCCSIASCSASRSSLRILSISSTAAIPLSASTRAPASNVHRPSPNSSLTAAAVSPAAELLLPPVYKPRGAKFTKYVSNWLLWTYISFAIKLW